MKVPFKPGKYPRKYDPQKLRVHEARHRDELARVINYSWFHVEEGRLTDTQLQDIYDNIGDFIRKTLPQFIEQEKKALSWSITSDLSDHE